MVSQEVWLEALDCHGFSELVSTYVSASSVSDTSFFCVSDTSFCIFRRASVPTKKIASVPCWLDVVVISSDA